MENELNKIKEEDYINIKELFVSKEKEVKYKLKGIQNGIVNFCRNYNMFQNKTNFFNLTLREQFEFNQCIDFTGNKIKKDFKEMESFYSNCKDKCLQDNNYKSEEILDSIEQYNETKTDLFRPTLHPCVKECMDIFHYVSGKYYKYMFEDAGIYIELIDFKKHVE